MFAKQNEVICDLKKIACIILGVLLTFNITGCWFATEPSEYAMVSSVIYDITDNGDYLIVLELMDAASESTQIGGQASSNDMKSSGMISRAYGKTLREAISYHNTTLERVVFARHNQARFFTERFAKTDMSSMLDLFARSIITDEQPYMFIIKDDNPENIYKSNHGQSDLVGEYIYNAGRLTMEYTAVSGFITTLEYIKAYYEEGKQPVLGVVTLEPDLMNSKEGKQEKSVKIAGLAVFKDNKLVGYLDESQARAYNFITNNIQMTYLALKPKDSMFTATVQSSKASINTDFEEDKVIVNINLSLDFHIAEFNGTININSQKGIKKIQDIVNEHLTKLLKSTIQKCQMEFKSDIFGFGSYFHIQHPQIWKDIKQRWDDDYFANAEVNVTVNSTMGRVGQLLYNFHLED